MRIIIEYDGKYPTLCFGNLVVTIDNTRYVFPARSLTSNGSVWFDGNWNAHVEEGDWTISKWPKNFPSELKEIVEKKVNIQIPHGCCGGCV